MTEMEKLLTRAFWELLEEKPYKKITVKDIVDRCQVNRNTFYYHFDGITSLFEEALIAWEEKIFEDPRTLAHPLTCVLPISEDLMEHRAGVQNLIEAKVRDTFFGELSVIAHRAADMYVSMAEAEENAKAKTGTSDRRTAAAGGDHSGKTGAGESMLRMYFFRKPVNPADRSILVRFYRSALEGFVTSWIMDGMNSDLKYEVERLLDLLKE